MIYKPYGSSVFRFLLGILFIFIYCEYSIYFVTQIQCDWPLLSTTPKVGVEPLYAMVIADTHLLGSRNGHWFDKWRREWQMYRAFQTAITLHRPEVVFILGDLFDEGKWCSTAEFNNYVERFNQMFRVPNSTFRYAVVGNHDVGFHYRMTPNLVGRFNDKLNTQSVMVESIKGNHFVMINSMAMEGDGCSLCHQAMTELSKISDTLKCSSGSKLCKGHKKLLPYSRPILMQHYPLYRPSDSHCTGSDSAPMPEKDKLFEERWDCLSKESTDYLVDALNPRAVFGAHTHHGCTVHHNFPVAGTKAVEFTEYTVPSFSWRNREDPMYYLVTMTPEEVKVAKCGMPRESTMKATAVFMLIGLVLYLKYFNWDLQIMRSLSRRNNFLTLKRKL